ncbi:OmpA family protein [Croceiramulus getboli]|nr:OmpA family protein [Flavobacteriaceae bacterium YJPT1-3]
MGLKNFIGAFVVFAFWACLGIFYFSNQNKDRSSFLFKKETASSPVNPAEADPIVDPNNLEIETLDSLPVDSLLYSDVDDFVALDNALVELASSETESIASSKRQQGNKPAKDRAQMNEELGFLAEEVINSLQLEEETLPEEPINDLLYPKFKNTNLILNKRLNDYGRNLKELLAENPEKRVTVIGHTDNIGNGTDNYLLALERARQIKWYFVARLGIPRYKITAISKGETAPIYPNNSERNRQRNSRIEIIIKNK